MNRLLYRLSAILILTFSIYSSILHAQKQAYSLYNGGYIYGINGPEPYQGTILKFNDDSLEQIIAPANMSLSVLYSRAAYSDTNGDLIFASNGWRLVNREGEILSYKLWDQGMNHPGNTSDTTDILVPMGPLFLDDPGNPNGVYLLYGQHKSVTLPGFSAALDIIFSYAYLDESSRSLVSQNNHLPVDTTSLGDMQACRHANGRDWWIIKPKRYENQYIIGLLDPTGFHFEEVTIPGLSAVRQANTFSQFSFEGNRFVHYTTAVSRNFHVFDFDRCTGTLSNLQVFDVSDSLILGSLPFFCLSPNGTKAYLKRAQVVNPPLREGILQYDFNTGTFTNHVYSQGSAPILSPNGKTVLIETAILGPNGFPLENFLSEIMNPNEAGEACNLQINKYPVNNTQAFAMNSNYANFKLDALESSGCDTLGLITQHMSPVAKLKVYPNPSSEYFTIETDGLLPAKLFVRDIHGNVVLEQTLTLVQTTIREKWQALPAGIYSLEVQHKQQRGMFKVMKE
jgi:hypothetical protein